jgi:predicted nucleotidyltransferase
MKLPEEIKNQIVQALKPLDPEKVILFGSYAYGTPHKDSDIDLYIVTKDDFTPQNFREKSQIFLKYARKLYDLEKEFPIDLIVHTKQMNEKWIELNRIGIKEILEKGVSIL